MRLVSKQWCTATHTPAVCKFWRGKLDELDELDKLDKLDKLIHLNDLIDDVAFPHIGPIRGRSEVTRQTDTHTYTYMH